MDIKFLHLKKIVFCGYTFKNEYNIFYKDIKIGEINFIKKKRILVISFLSISKEYRRQGYGYLLIQYLLSHYKIDCIIGETLPDARSFWAKCIKKYNGQRKNVSYCENCTSSFVIPKYSISRREVYDLLEYVNNEI